VILSIDHPTFAAASAAEEGLLIRLLQLLFSAFEFDFVLPSQNQPGSRFRHRTQPLIFQ
jgi:hypothetical protein